MATSQQQFTATVVFEFAWEISRTSKQTISYTKTYVGSPGVHTVYAVVFNPALPSSLQVETVGIPYTMTPLGGLYTQKIPATVATHSLTTPAAQTSPNYGSATAQSLFFGEPSSGGSSEWTLSVNCLYSLDRTYLYCLCVMATLGFICGFLVLFDWKKRRDRYGMLQEDQDGKMVS